MQADGLTPIAFGDKDGWPAMGTFDILNLRLNGYDFHVDLMAGKEKWTDPKVTTVFQKWAEILPFHAKDYAGLTWQNAADTLVQKKSGMYLLGLFVSAQFAATKDQADLDDLDFFPFPTLGTAVRRRGRARRADRHLADRRQVAEPRGRDRRRQGVPRVLGQGLHPGRCMFKNQPGLIPTAKDADTSTYSAAPEEGRRDRRQGHHDHPVPRPRHAFGLRRRERHAELPADVPAEPDQDLAAYQKTIQDFWDSLPPLAYRPSDLDAMSDRSVPIDRASVAAPPVRRPAGRPASRRAAGARYSPPDRAATRSSWRSWSGSRPSCASP